MKRLKYLFAAIMAFMLWSCSSDVRPRSEIRADISRAEIDMHEGRIEEAVNICNDLMDSSDTLLFTWKDYTRVAGIYAVAYEQDVKSGSAMAKAGRCLSRAHSMNADSVMEYIFTHEPEYAGALNTVVHTLGGLSIDKSNIGDHEMDESADTQHED